MCVFIEWGGTASMHELEYWIVHDWTEKVIIIPIRRVRFVYMLY